ncbi:MAG: PLP-dependent transferase [Actinomycetia bacterium]|nr:PLP-dependent transferase [Actinomycetes bacterium]
MNNTSGGHLETWAVTAGRTDDHNALAPVLWASTAYTTDTVDQGRQLAAGPGAARFYSRYGNPTVRNFEEAVAALEGAPTARAFASGMGAISAVVLGLCGKGSHIVAQNRMYAGTTLLLQTVCPRFGIDVTFVDATVPGALTAAVRPGETTLVLTETPANPRLDIVDLDELGAIEGPFTVVDSTFATPLGQQPLTHGVDLVVHSATKAMAGHNDATLGVVAGATDRLDWLWSFAVLQGANASPYDALNGLHELAARQMKVTGGLLTIDLHGGLEAGTRFVEGTRLALLVTSLGGPETLVTHPASTTHVGLDPDQLDAAGIGPGTVRISVGLEHPDDLAADSLQALA